jgi:hypothetical protein
VDLEVELVLVLREVGGNQARLKQCTYLYIYIGKYEGGNMNRNEKEKIGKRKGIIGKAREEK